MKTDTSERQSVESFAICKEIEISAPIDIAFEEARKLKSGYLGTEHLLLGILVEGEGVAAHALRSSGVTEETVRDELERLVDEEDR